MDMNNFLGGQYLAKTDVDTNGVTVQIAQVYEDTVGDEKEVKAICEFVGDTKSLILNKTNIRVLCAMFGNDSKAWTGRHINIFNDVTVVFNGAVGGLRVRPSAADAVSANVPPAAPQAPLTPSEQYEAEQRKTAQSMATAPIANDDVPF